MAQQIINVGIAGNDGTGDSLRAAGQKINANFAELYGTAPSVAVQISQAALSLAQAAYAQGNSAYVMASTIPLALKISGTDAEQNTWINPTLSGSFIYASNVANNILIVADDVTIPIANGFITSLVVDSNVSVLITAQPNTQVKIIQSGTGVLGNRTVSPYGTATLFKVSANTWFVSGPGVS